MSTSVDSAEPATLRELLARQVGREAAEEIMTTAEMLRREGEARGVQKGELLGSAFYTPDMAAAARTIDPAEAVDLATRRHEPVIAERDGRPLAAVIPIDLYG